MILNFVIITDNGIYIAKYFVDIFKHIDKSTMLKTRTVLKKDRAYAHKMKISSEIWEEQLFYCTRYGPILYIVPKSAI